MDGEAAVRAARERYNTAIIMRDPATITACLTHDCELVASTGAVVIGRDALLAHWTHKFQHDAEVAYVRETATVTIVGDVADERGTWSGHWTHAGGRVEGRGDYAAAWRRGDDGEWRVASETFKLTAC